MTDDKYCCKLLAFLCTVLAFVGIIIGVAVILSKTVQNGGKSFRENRPIPPDGPTIHFYPTFIKSGIEWQREEGIEDPLIEYNKRDDTFVVKKANIFSISVKLHFDVTKLSPDSIGAACIILSDGHKKCKADIFLDGSSGVFHMKEKIFARPGFSFSVRVLKPASTIRAVARNVVAITQSFHSGPDGNSTNTRIT